MSNESSFQKAERLVQREIGFCASTLADDLYKMYWACVRGLADRTAYPPVKMPDISFGEDEVLGLYNDKNGEVFEHWPVSNWLMEKLRSHGETVVEIAGLNLWCRTTTGQQIAADEVMREIAEEAYAPIDL